MLDSSRQLRKYIWLTWNVKHETWNVKRKKIISGHVLNKTMRFFYYFISLMTDQKKFLNTLYQFESSVPRRDYFSKVPPVKWNFQCYCANREQKERSLNAATLRRDFLSDLQWLQSQNRNLPRELKQYIKSLEVKWPKKKTY
jgi:hypothetical protein